MDITVPIIGFIFVCIIFPHIVKNKPQFYMAFAIVLVILSLRVVSGLMSSENGFYKFLRVIEDVLWIFDLILLVLASGGLSLHDLRGELGNAFEVMRRGEDTKTVIVPLTGEKPKSREEAAAERAARVPPTPRKPEGDRTIPLD